MLRQRAAFCCAYLARNANWRRLRFSALTAATVISNSEWKVIIIAPPVSGWQLHADSFKIPAIPCVIFAANSHFDDDSPNTINPYLPIATSDENKFFHWH
jgi:hypothetical protein